MISRIKTINHVNVPDILSCSIWSLTNVTKILTRSFTVTECVKVGQFARQDDSVVEILPWEDFVVVLREGSVVWLPPLLATPANRNRRQNTLDGHARWERGLVRPGGVWEVEWEVEWCCDGMWWLLPSARQSNVMIQHATTCGLSQLTTHSLKCPTGWWQGSHWRNNILLITISFCHSPPARRSDRCRQGGGSYQELWLPAAVTGDIRLLVLSHQAHLQSS